MFTPRWSLTNIKLPEAAAGDVQSSCSYPYSVRTTYSAILLLVLQLKNGAMELFCVKYSVRRKKEFIRHDSCKSYDTDITDYGSMIWHCRRGYRVL